MIGETQRKVPSSSRSIAAVGLTTAAYVALSTIVALVAGPVLRGYPPHFLRGLLMSSAAAISGRMWSATSFGVVSGIAFLFTIPAPAPYLLAASPVAGILYDLVVRYGGDYSSSTRRARNVLLATSASGAGEGLVAMAVLIFTGVISGSVTILAIITVAAVAANVALSCAGAYVSLLMMKRNVI